MTLRYLIGLVLLSAGIPGAASDAPAAVERSAAAHRLELDRSAIRGNQELPRVMVILPWKDPGVAELAGRPFNSLIEEVLSPVDRDEFRRELDYFEQVTAERPAVSASANRKEVIGP